MWQEAKANDKRIKELMVDHKKRAERRRAYFESRLGDPQQLLRVIGSATKLYADAEQFYYHENTDNLMPWQGNPDIKIDRFDGRSLLDYVPGSSVSEETKEEREMSDELNFERYHDLIEAERLHVSEAQRLREVEEEWTKLLDRHQAKLAMLNTQQKSNSKRYGYDYGTHKIHSSDYEEDTEKESQLLKEVDILQYVDDLTDKDKKVLNEMSGKYGIKSYARLLRVAKKDRDDELRSLQKKQSEEKSKEGSNSRKTNRRKRRRRRDRDRDYERDHYDRYRRRHSPTYEPFHPSSESESSEEDDIQNSPVSNVVIEFGSTTSNESPIPDHTEVNKSTENVTHAPTVEKKLTPMEKLKLKMRAGLEKQIVLDEKEKREKEREKEREKLQQLARRQGLPPNTYLRPPAPTREETERADNTVRQKERYRSPSSSPEMKPHHSSRRSRSPSPELKPHHSSRRRSPSPELKAHQSSRRRSLSSEVKAHQSSRRIRSPSPAGDRKSSDRHRNYRYRTRSPDRSRRRDTSPHYKRRRSRSSDGRRSYY